MYIEWKPENSDCKPLLLYYLQLYIEKFEKPYFFAKGNVTSTRKIIELSNKYTFNPYFYLYLNFMTKERDMKYLGYKFMNSIPYLTNFIKIVEKKTYRQYEVPKPLYTTIKNDLKSLDVERLKTQPEELADLLFTSKIHIYTFLYLIITFDIKDIIKPKAVQSKLNKLLVLIDRGVIPRNYSLFNFETYEEYCAGTTELDLLPPKTESDPEEMVNRVG
jgi:hypothetical protein